jgi:glutathione S-transferase
MPERYRIYGNLESRETMTLTTVLMAKGLAADLVEETASLALELALRSGQESGPYLRTPDGFVLGDLHAILNWIERAHPTPELLPRTPVRRICTRLLEDWIEFWLPRFARRSWASIEKLGAHLKSSRCLLGPTPTRADWLLAGWLEAEVVNRTEARAQLDARTPNLSRFASRLLEARTRRVEDDAIPISLLAVLQDLAEDYHSYLASNQQALKDHADRFTMDLGLGPRTFRTQRVCELRRVEIAQDLASFEGEERRNVRRILEPIGAWHVLSLPPVIESMDPSDPRSL